MRGASGARAFEFEDEGERPQIRLKPDATDVAFRGSLRLARRPGLLRGPGKYRVLEHRRRQAQIRARRVLDLLDLAESRSKAR